MTVASSTVKNQYTGTGSTNVYSFTFYTFAQTDLTVSVMGVNAALGTFNVITPLTLNVDYTVTGVATPSGGSITLVNSGQIWLTGGGNLSSDYAITILRSRPSTQLTNIRDQASYYPETIEDEFDMLAMAVQQQAEQLARCLQIPTNDTTGLTQTLAAAGQRANLIPKFDANGNLTVVALSSLNTTVTQGTWTPGIAGSTTAGTAVYTVQLGKYIQIGNAVTVSGSIVTTSISGGSGNALITGLPFTSANTGQFFNSIIVGFASGITYTNTGTFLGGIVNILSTKISLQSMKSGSVTAVAYADLASGVTINFSGTYFTT